MESALGATTVFMLGFMLISVFKKHILINLAIFFLAIGCVAQYFESGYSGFGFVLAGLIAICGFELYEMSKMRW